MATCVKEVPYGSVVGWTSNGFSVFASEGFMVSDANCASGMRVYTQDEITALVSAGPGSGPGTGPDADYLAQLGIDGPTVALVLAAGAAPVIGSYLMGWLIGLAKGIIKKI